jgi:hypothetical protein
MPSYPATTLGQTMLYQFSGTLEGQQLLSTFKYQIITVGTEPTWDVAAAAFNVINVAGSGMESKFCNCCPTSYLLNNIWAQLIFPTRWAKLVFPRGDSGAFPQDASTANLAAVITRKGIQANKKNIGSLHVPTSNLDPGMTTGLISTGLKTALGILAGAMLTVVTTPGGTVFAPCLFPPKATTVGQAVFLNTAYAQNTVRVMRRRTVGVGK